MSQYGKTTKVINQLSGLVHKTNELVQGKTQYQMRFEAMNIERTERYRQQKKLRDQLAKQILGGNLDDDEDDLDGKFFYDNEYNLPEDVIEHIMKFLLVKDRSRNQILQEWQVFYKDRNDFDKNRLDKLVFELYDKRKYEQEHELLFIKPISWIDEIERTAEKMYELEIKDLDYVIDQNISFEQLSELPLLTWEEQLFRQRDINAADIHSLLDESRREKQSMDASQIALRDHNYILEDDEDRNFSREMDIVGDDVRTAVHRYNKQQEIDHILTKSIDRLMDMNSVSSNGSQQNELGVTMQNINKPAQEIIQENIENCLAKLAKREMTPQQVQEALNLTEEQLKQMYVLYQKARHFDRMQDKFRKLKEAQDKALEELKARMVTHDHLAATNLHGKKEYVDVTTRDYSDMYGQGEPEYNLTQQLPLLKMQQAFQWQLKQEQSMPQQQQQLSQQQQQTLPPSHQPQPQTFHSANAQYLEQQKGKSVSVQQDVNAQQDHFIKLNEDYYLQLMKELKIKLNIYLNQGKHKEAQLTQSKIQELHELYVHSKNSNILYYNLRQFKEQLSV